MIWLPVKNFVKKLQNYYLEDIYSEIDSSKLTDQKSEQALARAPLRERGVRKQPARLYLASKGYSKKQPCEDRCRRLGLTNQMRQAQPLSYLLSWLLVFVFNKPSPSICIIMGEGDCLLSSACCNRTDSDIKLGRRGLQTPDCLICLVCIVGNYQNYFLVQSLCPLFCTNMSYFVILYSVICITIW